MQHQVVAVGIASFGGTGERRLVELRAALQQTMHGALVAGMEGLIGREVKALIGGSHLDPDIASEAFVLDGKLGERGRVPKRGVLPDGSVGMRRWEAEGGGG